MPNKDSFTFSDKLKKSKSLPLSKRIPSRVGGDGKAKRTLIQRAQRDLPFIIVAAAALLLLPVLSRDNGGADYEGATSGYNDFVPAEEGVDASYSGGAQDITPSSGFRDPLSLIIRKGGEDSAGIHNSPDVTDDYNYNQSYDVTSGSGSGDTTSGKSYTTKTYAPAARDAVRNAVQRKATQINALRNSKTFMGGGAGGVSRTLAIGGAPQSSSSASGPRVNARPVALHPMTSAGKEGRSMTGEGLYAEAARSIGALNSGPAKQALFDAQLRNVDGTPLGAVGGAPNIGGAGGRIGAGGAPSNNVGYKPQLPWWWDFEKQKIMDRWKLWHYNFEAALSGSLVKIGTGLFQCLATGNADGKVDKFLGDPGGSPDYVCAGAEDDILAWNDEKGIAGDTTSGSGDNQESKSNANLEAWWARCVASGGTPKKDISGKKNMLDVRLRCLGLKYKDSGLYRMLQKVQYMEKNGCVGVNNDPMSFEFIARQGKSEKKKNFGHYILGYKDDVFSSVNDTKVQLTEPDPQVICIGRGATLSSDCAKAIKAKEAAGWKITAVRGFTATNRKLKDGKAMDSARKDLEALKSMSKVDIKSKYGNKTDATGMTGYNAAVAALEKEYAAGEKLNKNDGSDTSDADFESTFTKVKNMVNSGNPVYEAYIEDNFNVKVEASCSVNRLATTEIGERKSNSGYQNTAPVFDEMSMNCTENEITNLNPLGMYTFATQIQGPAPHVYAVVVEYTQSATGTNAKQNDAKTNTMLPVVKQVREFGAQGNGIYKKEGGVYQFDSIIGSAGVSSDTTRAQSTAGGTGKVFWVVSQKPIEVKVKDGSTVPSINIGSSALFNMKGAANKTAVCIYRWGCNAGNACGADEKPVVANAPVVQGADFCRGEDGKIYEAAVTDAGDTYIAKNYTPVASGYGPLDDSVKKFKESKGQQFDPNCQDCYNEFAASLKKCQPICKKMMENLFMKSRKDGDKMLALEGTDPIQPDLLASLKVDVSKCPYCHEKEAIVPVKRDDDPCDKKLINNFALGNFTNMQAKDAKGQNFDDVMLEFYRRCVILNRDGTPRTDNVTVYVVGNTDMAGEPTTCTDENSCKLNDIRAGSKNVALSEARAITAAKKIMEKFKVFDVSTNYFTIKYDFDSKGVAGFTPATKTYIDNFNSSESVGLGQRVITIKVIGAGSYDMIKDFPNATGNKRQNIDYRSIRVAADMSSAKDAASLGNLDNAVSNFITDITEQERSIIRNYNDNRTPGTEPLQFT